MKYPGRIIAAILFVAVCLLYIGGPVAMGFLGVMVVVIICLPPKWDPAIQFKEQTDSKKEQSNG